MDSGHGHWVFSSIYGLPPRKDDLMLISIVIRTYSLNLPQLFLWRDGPRQCGCRGSWSLGYTCFFYAFAYSTNLKGNRVYVSRSHQELRWHISRAILSRSGWGWLLSRCFVCLPNAFAVVDRCWCLQVPFELLVSYRQDALEIGECLLVLHSNDMVLTNKAFFYASGVFSGTISGLLGMSFSLISSVYILTGAAYAISFMNQAGGLSGWRWVYRRLTTSAQDVYINASRSLS